MVGGRGRGQSQGLLGRAGSRRSGHQESGCNTEQQERAVSLVASGTKASPYLPACHWAPARQWEIFFPVCFSIWETLRQSSSWEELRAQGGHMGPQKLYTPLLTSPLMYPPDLKVQVGNPV